MSTSVVVRFDPKAAKAAPPTSAHLVTELWRARETAMEASSIGLTGERLRGSSTQSDSTSRRSKKREISTSTSSGRSADREDGGDDGAEAD